MVIGHINSPLFPIGQHIPSSTPSMLPTVHSSPRPHRLPWVPTGSNSPVKLPPQGVDGCMRTEMHGFESQAF